MIPIRDQAIKTKAAQPKDLGLGDDAIHEINPGLVYCALKGFLTGVPVASVKTG